MYFRLGKQLQILKWNLHLLLTRTQINERRSFRKQVREYHGMLSQTDYMIKIGQQDQSEAIDYLIVISNMMCIEIAKIINEDKADFNEMMGMWNDLENVGAYNVGISCAILEQIQSLLTTVKMNQSNMNGYFHHQLAACQRQLCMLEQEMSSGEVTPELKIRLFEANVNLVKVMVHCVTKWKPVIKRKHMFVL
jgi:hypothetical protein